MAVEIREVVSRAVLLAVGLAVGGLSAVVELVFLVVALPLLGVAPERVRAGARRLARVEQRRIARFHRVAIRIDHSSDRALRYLGVRWLVGGLGLGILLFVMAGAATGAVMLAQLLTGGTLGDFDSGISWYDPFVFVLSGTLLVFVAVQGLLGVERLDLALARRFLGPTVQEVLRRRVSELTESRADVVAAVNAERRRIERDLHDGVQQRLVALGMLLGRARRARDRDVADDLLGQAHELAGQTVADLREVTWRVYPVALDAGGLRAALESLAEMSPVPVHLRYTVVGPCPETVEVAAYFVASEAVTNAVKHAGASRVDLEVERMGAAVIVRISDDGRGGADAGGGGLSGLARRVVAADGVFAVNSPVGGPTVITAVLPCD